MNMNPSLLFQPIRLGALLIPERILMGSMHLGLDIAPDGMRQMADFYNRRFQGGVHWITTGGIAVNEAGKGSLHFLSFSQPEDIRKLKELNSYLPADRYLCAQLFHAGRYAYHRQLVAPSAIRASINRYTPQEMDAKTMQATIQDFAHAARIAREAGFAAVEIMGSEGYLLNEFFSGVTNRREDAYGKDKSLFPVEVARAVRKEVGNDFTVIFRMSGIDLIPGNPDREEVIHLATQLEECGMSALNIGIGWHESRVPTISGIVPPAAFAGISEIIKQNVHIPVIASNRINCLQDMEEILTSGKADMISMARPFLADPDLVLKLKNRQEKSINTCIACNQACLDHTFQGKRVSCMVNPEANNEKKYTIPSIQTKKTATVIGAGPAGMQSALFLARHGFAVELIDKNHEIGGQLQLARKIPGKSEFGETIRYFKEELKRNHVLCKTVTIVDFSELEQNQSDFTIVATGTKPRDISIDGIENLPHGLYDSYLRDEFIPGKSVIVIGGGGIGCDVAFRLSHQKKQSIDEYYKLYNLLSWKDPGIKSEASSHRHVSIMRRNGKIGSGLGQTTGWALLQELTALGVDFYSSLTYKRITSEGMIIQLKSGEEKFIPADSIVICAGQEANQLAGICNSIYYAGSVQSPGMDAKDSFLSGLEIAKQITELCR